jgi:hypothetical protein
MKNRAVTGAIRKGGAMTTSTIIAISLIAASIAVFIFVWNKR